MKKLSTKRKYFILTGCYRSSTTKSAQILTKTPEIIATNELHLTWGNWGRLVNVLPRLIDKFPKQTNRASLLINCHRSQKFMKKLQNKLKQVYKEAKTNRERITIQFPKINLFSTYTALPIPIREKWISIYEEYYQKDNKYFCEEDPNLIVDNNIWHALYSMPSPKIIMILRDPREVTYSQVSRYKHGPNVGWTTPDFKAAFNYSRNWLKVMKNWEFTKQKLNKINQSYIEIYHDNLCNHPKKPANKIANYLNVELQPLLSQFKEEYDSKHQRKWETNYPNLTNKLPKDWVQMANKYNLLKD
jgi:hypothetical protein